MDFKNILKLLAVLCLSCHFPESLAQTCGDFGTLSQEFTESRERNFFLNTQDPAPCDGNVTQFQYCYYRSDQGLFFYHFTFAVYRETNEGSNTYTPVSDAFTTGTSFLNHGSATFSCRTYIPLQIIQIQAGDIIGACIYDPPDEGGITGTRVQLDVVGQNAGTDRFLMRANDNMGCGNSAVPSSVSNLNRADGFVLHVNASIVPNPTTPPPPVVTSVAMVVSTSVMSDAVSSTAVSSSLITSLVSSTAVLETSAASPIVTSVIASTTAVIIKSSQMMVSSLTSSAPAVMTSFLKIPMSTSPLVSSVALTTSFPLPTPTVQATSTGIMSTTPLPITTMVTSVEIMSTAQLPITTMVSSVEIISTLPLPTTTMVSSAEIVSSTPSPVMVNVSSSVKPSSSSGGSTVILSTSSLTFLSPTILSSSSTQATSIAPSSTATEVIMSTSLPASQQSASPMLTTVSPLVTPSVSSVQTSTAILNELPTTTSILPPAPLPVTEAPPPTTPTPTTEAPATKGSAIPTTEAFTTAQPVDSDGSTSVATIIIPVVVFSVVAAIVLVVIVLVIVGLLVRHKKQPSLDNSDATAAELTYVKTNEAYGVHKSMFAENSGSYENEKEQDDYEIPDFAETNLNMDTNDACGVTNTVTMEEAMYTDPNVSYHVTTRPSDNEHYSVIPPDCREEGARDEMTTNVAYGTTVQKNDSENQDYDYVVL